MKNTIEKSPQLILTTASQTLTTMSLPELGPGAKTGFGWRGKATIYPEQTRQAIKHFGGSFNEQGWDALLSLSEAERQAVLVQLFDPQTGLGLTECRIPIGASDYALDRYCLAEQADDYELKSFSIERDRQALIPFIKAAQKVQPALRFWASAWSPPPWMKDNQAFDSGALRDDPAVYKAYALYLLKFIQAYAAEGIPIAGIVPQNEPSQLTRYPSCDWKRGQYRLFIRDYLGPLFKREGIDTEIWLGTINKPDFNTHIKSTMVDPDARDLIAGIGLQWWGLKILSRVRKAYPDQPIMQTETDCGNHHWEKGFDPDRPQNDFTYAAYTWRKLRAFFDGGVESYMLWNLVLNETGKNIDSRRPWPQNSPVVVDRANKQVTYTPMFHMFGHFCRLIQKGARLVVSKAGRGTDLIAFNNPDGAVIAQLLNDSAKARVFYMTLNGKTYQAELPAKTFATAIIPPTT